MSFGLDPLGQGRGTEGAGIFFCQLLVKKKLENYLPPPSPVTGLITSLVTSDLFRSLDLGGGGRYDRKWLSVVVFPTLSIFFEILHFESKV